jgi:hypothetical protein
LGKARIIDMIEQANFFQGEISERGKRKCDDSRAAKPARPRREQHNEQTALPYRTSASNCHEDG